LLRQNLATGQTPASLTSTTIQAAVLFAAGQASAAGKASAVAIALAEGVLKTMLLSKLKLTVAMLMLLAMLGIGVAAFAQTRPRDSKADPNAAQQPVRSDKPVVQPTPENKAEAPPKLVAGIVKAVDAGKRTITVTHRDGETTFTVADDVHVNIDGKRGELAKVPVGASVFLSHFADATTVGVIHAQGAAVFGSVKAVDQDKNIITVTTGQGEEKTYTVAPDTEIAIDGQGGQTLNGIPRGANLHGLNLCVDQRTAFSINVEGPTLHHVPVKSVDADRLTITFGDKAHPDLAG